MSALVQERAYWENPHQKTFRVLIGCQYLMNWSKKRRFSKSLQDKTSTERQHLENQWPSVSCQYAHEDIPSLESCLNSCAWIVFARACPNASRLWSIAAEIVEGSLSTSEIHSVHRAIAPSIHNTPWLRHWTMNTIDTICFNCIHKRAMFPKPSPSPGAMRLGRRGCSALDYISHGSRGYAGTPKMTTGTDTPPISHTVFDPCIPDYCLFVNTFEFEIVLSCRSLAQSSLHK